ncbi:MAG TPA: hypothetical protein VK674_07420 [Candidatus Limnocylindria bacterium]|nr:hypothetical protein [Candidatus Limnocylindria bacterium]
MKHLVGHSRNGAAVYVDLIHSEAAKHIAHQPHVLGLVGEVLKQTTLKGPEVTIEHDMGRTIGYSFVVKTTDKDTIFYAQLLRDSLYTRFVKNGKPLSTQYLTLILYRQDDKAYELHDTWIGRIRPPRPGSTNETSDSKPYWDTHALVLDNQPMQSRTVTKICPY